MLTYEKHIDNLVRHIELVREAGILLAKRLAESGRKDFARILLGNIFVHDASKFAGIEWDYLHAGEVPQEELQLAIRQHQQTNMHHPEFWGGFDNMPEVYVAEMVCDWYARSMEFGTGLRDWINEKAVDKFKIDINCENYKLMMNFVDTLLINYFTTKNEDAI